MKPEFFQAVREFIDDMDTKTKTPKEDIWPITRRIIHAFLKEGDKLYNAHMQEEKNGKDSDPKTPS